MAAMWGLRTNFSVGESILDIETVLPKVKALGYTHVALADTMSVSALIDGAQRAKKAGVELISGCTLRVQAPAAEGVYFYPKVYIKSGDGFVALLKALSDAGTEKVGQFLTFGQFIALLSSREFVCTTGDAYSALQSAFSDDDVRTILSAMIAACSAAQCVLELVAVPTPAFAAQNARALRFAGELHLRTIMSGYPQYETPDDAEARNVMAAIIRNQKVDSKFRRIQGKQFALKDVRAMVAELIKSCEIAGRLKLLPATCNLRADLAAAISRTNDLADECPFRWSKAAISLPRMAPDEFVELVTQCKAKWRERIEQEVLGYKPDASILPEYKDRLSMELKVLKQMGFSNYFLLVSDLVNWSKQNGIIVGPGRGSVGGSLVAYVLGITEVDPIRFKLLFERFINPERLDLPDADLDFMSERRHEVIEYLKGKYGVECVGNISNYNTLGSPAALRGIGTYYQLPEKEFQCSKYIPKEHGIPKPLADAKDAVPELAAFATAHPQKFQLAQKLEGQIRSMGTHAAGVVVAAEPLDQRAVVVRKGEQRTVNWDKRVVEEQGLVKIDILGLANLDVLKRAIDKIEWSYGKKVDLLQLRLDDTKVLDAFGRGDTIGVFQFESSGMRKLLKSLAMREALTFEELSAATALYRPGPLDSGLLDDFVAIRQGAAIERYDHPAMKPALQDTFGVIVYQEQVMQLARDLAGMTMAEADHLRKAMGKKDKEKMAEQRSKWVEGCVSYSSMDRSLSEALFDKIELFAGYAFNRSHSVEYALISYWSMWLKINYPHEFYAASLEIFKEEKLQGLVEDAASRNIEILPPDINDSTRDFRRVGDHLIAPFNRIKGISESCETAILEARVKAPGGRFSSLAEFEALVNKTKCNKRHRENLELVGAFAGIVPGSKPARHPDRVKAQIDLLPGLVIANVRVDRPMVGDEFARQAISRIIYDLRTNVGGMFPMPRLGKKPKFMVVMDCPTKQEEERGRLLEGDSSNFLRTALKENGLSLNDGYFTTLCKAPKRERQLTNEEINVYKPYFEREVLALKPPVIVALGSSVARHLCPDERGGILDLAGKVVYHREWDCSIVIGFNPQMIYHDPNKQDLLDALFTRVAEILA